MKDVGRLEMWLPVGQSNRLWILYCNLLHCAPYKAWLKSFRIYEYVVGEASWTLLLLNINNFCPHEFNISMLQKVSADWNEFANIFFSAGRVNVQQVAWADGNELIWSEFV